MSEEPGLRAAGDSTSGRESHFLPLDRFNAFSDGVFAIAITLLVLDIAIPHAGVRVLPALREQWPEFLGYYISFAFIGGIWMAHSGVTKFMKHGDSESYALNLLLLLLVGLLPFSTALMVTHLNGVTPSPQSCSTASTCCSPPSCSACSSATSRESHRCSSTSSLRALCGASPGGAGPRSG